MSNENSNAVTRSPYKSPNKNIDKSFKSGHSCEDECIIPKNTAATCSNHRNKFANRKIPESLIKIDCLNIDKAVFIIDDVMIMTYITTKHQLSNLTKSNRSKDPRLQ